MDDTGNAQNLPEKYQGKSVEEIIRMHQEAEEALGRQGQEIGTLRTTVHALSNRQTVAPGPQAEPADERRAEWARLGQKLILDPDNAAPELVERIVEESTARARRERNAQVTQSTLVDQFMRDNPKLARYPEIVSAVGDLVFRQHSDWSMQDILAETKRIASQEILSLRQRIKEEDGETIDKTKVAGITTSGGIIEESRGSSAPAGAGTIRTPEERDAIAREIAEIRNFRKDKMLPPRSAIRK